MNNFEDLTGKRYGRLIVIKKAPKLKSNTTRWECICDCGKIIQTTRTSLIRGQSKSCGCYAKELFAKRNSKINEYKKENNYYKVKCSNKEDYFYIDDDDYEKVKDYCWYITNNGYIATRNKENNKIILLHRFLIDGKIIDHIDRNKLNNRKENLRIVNAQQNSINKSMQINNKSGIVGVFYDKSRNKWCANLTYKNKTIMKRFNNFIDAKLYREKLEKKYFKEYAPIGINTITPKELESLKGEWK